MPYPYLRGYDLGNGTKKGSPHIEHVILSVRPEIVANPIGKNEDNREHDVIAPAKNGKKYDEPENEEIPYEGESHAFLGHLIHYLLRLSTGNFVRHSATFQPKATIKARLRQAGQFSSLLQSSLDLPLAGAVKS
ncbi:MAG: hypothetical protein A4E62_02837 [Syntrophorhabdus sp. PtaU1.Bin002]|nr:MAG: hypothetical protein A4E62_02837 [Syntrophorhabdus sp. PtaU1.Bin002]